jgi:hypothetical protein
VCAAAVARISRSRGRGGRGRRWAGTDGEDGKLHRCIWKLEADGGGPWLRKPITSHFQSIGIELNLKYIDPSYAIRSVPANPHDSVYRGRLANDAVHAAMSGGIEMVAGRRHGHFVHVPLPLANSSAQQRGSASRTVDERARSNRTATNLRQSSNLLEGLADALLRLLSSGFDPGRPGQIASRHLRSCRGNVCEACSFA